MQKVYYSRTTRPGVYLCRLLLCSRRGVRHQMIYLGAAVEAAGPGALLVPVGVWLRACCIALLAAATVAGVDVFAAFICWSLDMLAKSFWVSWHPASTGIIKSAPRPS